MEACSSEDSIKSQQFSSKAVEKRSGGDLEYDSDSSRKRVKLRDLESVIRSDGIAKPYLGSSKTSAKAYIVETVEKEVSRFAQECLNPNSCSLDEERLCKKSSTLGADHPALVSLDLNSELCIDTSACKETVAETNDFTQNMSNAKCEAANDNNNIKAACCRGLDLNEDASSTVSLARFNPFLKTHSGMKPKDAWQCRSSTGPLDNMSMKKWAEMKQNGFITPNYGSTHPVPKHRGRKSKAEVLKRKMEQAKKEQVDRFAKIAAPSGLLNGLNPGIINHVRNSKHVHSIIQALVNERGEKNNDQENATNSWIHQSNIPHGNASCNIVSVSRYAPDHQMPKYAHVLPCEDHKVECQDLRNVDGRLYGYFNDDPLALKLSSSAMMCAENASSLATEEPINAETVDSLSVKAANIASQWLQLLCQDIKGRLVALKRSKRRVQDVITTELPSLLSKEILSKQGNDSAKKATAELHRTRWMMMFDQMEQGLSKEEQQLETQLNQVNKMLAHCEKGLEYMQHIKAIGLPLPGTTEKGCRSGTEDPDGELAVKAAAASIYSTCSFALSMANVKCR